MKFNGQTEEKWGLCFAGGGGKGAYEIGVWRALEECTNIKFSAVAGTSVGALNAILFATKTVDEAEEIWRGITPDKLLKPKKETFIELLDNTLDIILNESGRNFMEYGILEELIRNNPKNDQFVKYVLEVNPNSGIKVGDELEFTDCPDCEEVDEEEVNKMYVIGPDGQPQMELVGGERIFSRDNTKTLIRLAKRAKKSKSDSDYQKLGRKMFKYLNIQDNRDPEFVDAPNNN